MMHTASDEIFIKLNHQKIKKLQKISHEFKNEKKNKSKIEEAIGNVYGGKEAIFWSI